MTGEVNILRLMIFPLMRNLLASLNWCEEYLVNSLSPKKTIPYWVLAVMGKTD